MALDAKSQADLHSAQEKYRTLKDIQETEKTKLIQLNAKLEQITPEYDEILAKLKDEFNVNSIEEGNKLLNEFLENLNAELDAIQKELLDVQAESVQKKSDSDSLDNPLEDTEELV